MGAPEQCLANCPFANSTTDDYGVVFRRNCKGPSFKTGKVELLSRLFRDGSAYTVPISEEINAQFVCQNPSVVPSIEALEDYTNKVLATTLYEIQLLDPTDQQE